MSLHILEVSVLEVFEDCVELAHIAGSLEVLQISFSPAAFETNSWMCRRPEPLQKLQRARHSYIVARIR